MNVVLAGVCLFATPENGAPPDEFSISVSRFQRKAAEDVSKKNRYCSGS
jgi:hypothetical protein